MENRLTEKSRGAQEIIVNQYKNAFLQGNRTPQKLKVTFFGDHGKANRVGKDTGFYDYKKALM